MATTPGQNIIDGVILSTSLTQIYLVTNNLIRTKVDAIAFTNFHATLNSLLTVQIISKGGSAGDGKILIDAKEIRVGDTYLAPELSGQGIKEGGEIQAFSSVATSINCTATGTEYST